MPIVPSPIPFDAQMRMLRAAAGLSQRRLAQRAEMSLGRVVEIENRYSAPTAEEKRRIFHALSSGGNE